MPWELTGEVETFARDAGDFLRSRPVEHTLLLTVLETVRRRGLHAYGEIDPLFGVWRSAGGAVEGALVHTPPHQVSFTATPPEATRAAVDALIGRPLVGVSLPADAAEIFAAEWSARTGTRAEIFRRLRLYALDQLVPPGRPPAGVARPAEPGDRDLVIRWVKEFLAFIGDPAGGAETRMTDERIESGLVTLWVDGGEPVCMVFRTPIEAGMVRIQYVYTPEERRGHGYASGATTAATRAALDEGAEAVVLNTDLANPTSNAIYQRLGYRPVEDRTVVNFR